MHERTRKRICRIAFFALCVIPTTLTAAWAAYQNRPAASDAAGGRLSRAIGCDAKLRGLARPQPGVRVASQVEFYPGDPQRPALQASELRWQDSSDQLAARMERIDVDIDQLGDLLKIARRWFDDPHPSELRARLLTIDGFGEGAAYRLRDPRVRCLASGNGEVQVQFVAAAGVESARLKMQVRRNRSGQLAIELDANETTVPLGLAAIGTPLARLAPAATYRGRIRWEQRNDRWHAVFSGQVAELQLGDLLPAGGLHRAAGECRLTIETLEFADGKIAHLAARLESSDAVLSRSLLVAAARCLYCGIPGELEAADPLPASQLAIGIQIDSKGMSIEGLLPNAASDGTASTAVLRRGKQELLRAPPPGYEHLPPVFLAQFVAGVDERWQWHWLPASQQAAHLFTLLPGQQNEQK